jgi:predicted dehydrogenase
VALRFHRLRQLPTVGGEKMRPDVRIGVVGCGHMGLRHVQVYREQGYEVVAFDLDPVALGRAVDLGVTAAESLDDLLLTERVHVVDIVLPNRAHASAVLRALLSGHDVICEKPLCLTPEEGVEIQRACDTSGRSVKVGYTYRFAPFIREFRARISAGEIGNPRFATIRLGASGSRAVWKHRRDEGGGASNEMLSHGLDLALHMFGQPAKIRIDSQFQVAPERSISGRLVTADAEDVSIATGRFGSTSVVVLGDLASFSPISYLEAHGTDGSLVTSGPAQCFRATASDSKTCTMPKSEQSMTWLEDQLTTFIEDFASGALHEAHTVADTLRLFRARGLVERTL